MLTQKEQIDAEWERRSLRKFMAGAWHVVEPATPFVGGFHIDAIAEHLELVTAGEIRKLIINVPPRHMKSLCVSVFWPAWEWASSPEIRWLFASYAQSLSNQHSLACRRVIESDWYRARWGNVFALTDDENRKTRFENDRTGVRMATSVGGTATGAGGDRIVYDDPHNANEVESEAIREGVIDWYDGTMGSRKNDPKKSAEVIIMQRLHEKDLTGHVLAMDDDWELLCLPAEYEPNRCRLTSGWTDPREKPGELLWEERMGEPELAAQRRRLGSYRYAGQYQQNPVPSEGGILKRRWWQYYEQESVQPRIFPFDADDGEYHGEIMVARPSDGWLPWYEIVQSWDCAFKDEDDSDFVVGQLWGRDVAQKYLIAQFRDHADIIATIAAMTAMTDFAESEFPKMKGHAKLIEEAANGTGVIQMLKRKVPGLIAVNPDRSKVARTQEVAPEIEAGDVFVPGAVRLDSQGKETYDEQQTPGWIQKFIDEATAFPKGQNDDQVDAATQALDRFAGRVSTQQEVRTGGKRRAIRT